MELGALSFIFVVSEFTEGPCPSVFPLSFGLCCLYTKSNKAPNAFDKDMFFLNQVKCTVCIEKHIEFKRPDGSENPIKILIVHRSAFKQYSI